jgi:hypothetical protein
MRAVLIAILVLSSIPALAQTGGRTRGADIKWSEPAAPPKSASSAWTPIMTAS